MGRELTRGLLSGLVDRPEEAPLMDLDLQTQVRRGSAGRGRGSQLLSPGRTLQEAGSPSREPRGRHGLRTPGHRQGCPAVPTLPLPGPRRAPQPLQGAPSEPQFGGLAACLGAPLLYVGAAPRPRPRPRIALGSPQQGSVRGLGGQKNEVGQVFPGSCIQPPCQVHCPDPGAPNPARTPKAELPQALSPVLG